MVLSVHLLQAGPRDVACVLRKQSALTSAPGVKWGQVTAAIPLGAGAFPPPTPDGVAMVAAWDDASALDAFEGSSALARRFDGGFSARLEPLRAYGGRGPCRGSAGRSSRPTTTSRCSS